MHSIVVVFPAPFGPISPKISPCSTTNDTSSTATVGPYVLRNRLTWMTGSMQCVRGSLAVRAAPRVYISAPRFA